MWSIVQTGQWAAGAGLNIDLDLTLAVQLTLFIGLWVYLTSTLFRPYLAARREREQNTDGARGEATQLQSRVDAAVGSYRETLTKARGEAAAQRAELVGEGEAKAQTVLSEARTDATKTREAAEAALKKEIVEARDDVRKQAAALSSVIVGRVLS